MSYEYKVVPAPARGLKAKGLKTSEDRFANALETAMNELAADGWEYLRADTLPCEQRDGIMSKTTVFQNMLVFRRAKPAVPTAAPRPARPEPQLAAPAPKAGAELLAERAMPKSKPATEGEIKPKTADDKKPSPDVAAE